MIDFKRILILAPHPDDEVLGCGGTMALWAQRGAHVHVLVVFDGAAGDPAGKFDKSKYVAMRQAEALAAGERLGVSAYTFWNMPEGHQATEAELERGTRALAQLVQEVQPDVILAPWAGDDHPDHRTVATVLSRLVQAGDYAGESFGFEVWSPLEPDLQVDISTVRTRKLEALREHQTQLAYDCLAARFNQLVPPGESTVYERFQRWESAA